MLNQIKHNLIAHRKAWGALLGLALFSTWLGKNQLWFERWGSPIVFLVLGCALAFYLYRVYVPLGTASAANKQTGFRIWPLLIFLAGMFAAMLMQLDINNDYPLNPYAGDIIPTLKIYAQRFLSGQRVYEPIAIGNATYEAGYLPLMWLPFALSEWMGMDFRVFALFWFAIGLAAVYYKWVWRCHWLNTLTKSFLSLLPWIFYLGFQYSAPSDYGFSVEPLSYGYHLLFFATVLHKHSGIRALGLVGILLSRYALILWIPLYVIVLFRKFGWRAAAYTGGLALAIVLTLALLFIRHDSGVWLRSQQSYTESALVEWQHMDYADPSVPYHLVRGRGFAFYFFSPASSLLPQIKILQKTQLILLILFVVFSSLLLFRLNENRLIVALYTSGLVYWVLFVSFLQVPYGYLFGNAFWWAFALSIFVFTNLQLQKSNEARVIKSKKIVV